MSQNTQISIDLGADLADEIDAAVLTLQARNSTQRWTRERVVLLAVHHGLRQLLRRHPRTKVSLPGTFSRLVAEDLQGDQIIVEDISVGGIKFKTAVPQLFMENQILEVEFRLDDRDQTLINRKIIISHLTGDRIGCEFCETDDAYHRVSAEAIEDYLLSKTMG